MTDDETNRVYVADRPPPKKSREDRAWEAETKRRMRRWLQEARIFCPGGERCAMLNRAIFSAYRDLVALDRENDARALLESDRQVRAGVWGNQEPPWSGGDLPF